MISDPGGRQRSTWRTHRLCLEAIQPDATFACILQDDALPCDDFARLVTAAIAEQPDRIIALFVPGVGHLARTVNIARMRGQRWLDWPAISFVPLVGVVYPADIARAIPAFADAKRISVGRADDAVISQFVRAHRIHPVAILPSLVEHLDSVPSVMGMPSGRGASHRVAAWYAQGPLPHLSSPIRTSPSLTEPRAPHPTIPPRVPTKPS